METLFLDTHVLIWLYQKEEKVFSKKAIRLINEAKEIFCSPISLLELDYLHELKKIIVSSHKIQQYLENTIELEIAEDSFSSIVHTARKHTWTRDPFDRILVAHTETRKAALLTCDRDILNHFSEAVW